MGEIDMIVKRYLTGIVLAGLLFVPGAGMAADTEKPLDNAEIVKLTKADLGDDVIIAKIKSASSVKFDTGTDALVSLKGAGVSKAVIAAMLDRASPPPPAAPASASKPAATGARDRDAGVERRLEGSRAADRRGQHDRRSLRGHAAFHHHSRGRRHGSHQGPEAVGDHRRRRRSAQVLLGGQARSGR